MTHRPPTEADADMQRADEPERHVGFTGTPHGMTNAQIVKLAVLIQDYDWLHHGDCWGSDREANSIARESGIKTESHPPINNITRAFCVVDRTNKPNHYLYRNEDIVEATERLIAAPNTTQEELRSGTWRTVRYAGKVGKPVTIVFPDGSVRDE